jgi:O-methyltransferase
MDFPFHLRTCLKHWRDRQRHLAIHEAFRDFTMTPDWLFADNLQLIETVRSVQGCVVECGVWRGGMSAGMARILGSQRRYFLFDSFEGLPPAQEVDGKKAAEWQNNPAGDDYNDNCTATVDYARSAMERSGTPSYELIKGWFKDTLPAFEPGEPIAVLRLDGDWYESTLTCLNHLFDRVAPGGLILLDDYYAWDGCSRAVHDFLSHRKASERLRTFRKLAYIEKLSADAPFIAHEGIRVPDTAQ